MIIAAQGTRADAGLAVGFTVSSRGLGIPVERLGHCAGMVVNSTRVFGVSTAVAALAAGFTVSSSSLGVSAESMARWAGTIESSDALASSPVAGQSALHVRCYAPFASSSVVIVSVLKRAGPGVVPVVVINYVSVMPVESPMTPAPSKTEKKPIPKPTPNERYGPSNQIPGYGYQSSHGAIGYPYTAQGS